MKRIVATMFFGMATAVMFSACSKGKGGGLDFTDTTAQPKPYIMKNIKEVFGFYGQSRYSYCPSLVRESDGTVHMFFCGTQNMIMVDNIYHVRIHPDGTQTAPAIVLTPGTSGAWDDHHTCDPSVVKGDFSMGGKHYQYAMFYLSNMYGVYYNEIGVAFANDLDAASWDKYPYQVVAKTWSSAGDQAIGSSKAWGVGQPSALSFDKKAVVLLTYTIGDLNGTRIVWAKVDLSDMDHYAPVTPARMIDEGLYKYDYSGKDVTTDADFAIDATRNQIVIARPVHPNPDATYPTHIEQAVEVSHMSFDDFLQSKGKWVQMMRITRSISGFPRNHNPGIERDAYGYITNWARPVIYYTVSLAEPDVAPLGTSFAEWTYHIWKGEVMPLDAQ